MRSTLLTLILLSVTPAVFSQPFKGLVLPFREVTISSPVEARIDSLLVREGDSVEAGDLLVSLYSGMEVLEARRAAAAVDLRQFEFETSKNLFDQEVVSEDEALQAKIELDLAELTLDMAEEQVGIRELTTPIRGVVVERFREQGEMVRPTEPILTVVNLESVFVQFYVPAETLKDLEVGLPMSVEFPSLGLGRKFVGPVDFIDPRVDAASGLLRVRVKLDNQMGLIKAGVRALVENAKSQ